MNSRVREDERHEMVIRKLLKNIENKRCINCGSLGPQYVCTNFSIFVCTYCSGAHREFSHRIKSISMAKFTPGEVANLQSGGNGRAREIYFKELDLVRNPLPDSSDSTKLHNFIHHVYVERRYTGERPAPTKSQEGGRDDYGYHRFEAWKPGFQSISREGQNCERRINERFNNRARKSDVGGHQNEKCSPNRLESDWPPRKSYDDRGGWREEKANSEAIRDRAKSPVPPFSFRNCEDDGPPIQFVKEILGEDVPSLHVDLNGVSVSGIISAPVGLQKDGQSLSLNHLGKGEGEANAPVFVVKRVSSESMISLIDFSAGPEPVVAPGVAADPFAPNPAAKSVSDPFAPTPVPVPTLAHTSSNASILDLFGSDPFAVAAVGKPVPDLFAPVSTLKQAPDLFKFGGQGADADSTISGWVTFDFTHNSAPPEGYPNAFPASTARTSMTKPFSGGAAWDTSSSAGSGGWSAFGLQTAAPPAFVQSTAPVPLASSSSQRLNLFSTVESQINVSQSAMEIQMGFPSQRTHADKLQAPAASGRVRRELPQRGQQVATQPSRTRNPFDDDNVPSPVSFNMGSIQAALSQVGGSPSSVAPEWGQSIPQIQPTPTQYLKNDGMDTAVSFGHGMQLTLKKHLDMGCN